MAEENQPPEEHRELIPGLELHEEQQPEPLGPSGLSPDLEAKYSRKFFGEVVLFVQLLIGVVVLGGFLIYLITIYTDVLFSIDFAEIQWSYLNELTRLFVILTVAVFNVHLIYQVFKFIGRRVKIMGLLKEMGDALNGEGETLWRLRSYLWDEQNADIVEHEGSFMGLRDGIERAYKNTLDLREDMRSLVQSVHSKQDVAKFVPIIRAELKDCRRTFSQLQFPFFMDTGYSLGVAFYHHFRNQVNLMLDQIQRLMNQFENMAKIEDERKLERERTARLELERQHKLGEFTLDSHLDTFLQRINELSPERLKGKNHAKFLRLYNALHAKFESAGLIPPEKLARIAKDVERVDQIEEIIAFYDEKIRMVKHDSVDLTERREKARYWTELRDRHIAELRRQSAQQMAGGAAVPPPAEDAGHAA